ncbi:hypothetical protein H257_02664 [Aphanomyces astaci]|uniref:Uncharacterized protein n=1 Tax=Aphanomyces astaci TaxID=112090 RepID=W4H3R7_APHAT|nr:hypothetical protein H257_02664 [Aphanomyces astaci]ETV86236.1 hypothetical protein H257_02664 [Aphanomyces astaci]|eukprot:XP_009824708.1 hypothetical protein H257_02664 [Aphanomyces astaci]
MTCGTNCCNIIRKSWRKWSNPRRQASPHQPGTRQALTLRTTRCSGKRTNKNYKNVFRNHSEETNNLRWKWRNVVSSRSSPVLKSFTNHCRDAQLKRSLDQLKHRQVITETQLQHQQAAQDAQRKQLQLKDQLLTNYRTSIRNLENKLISQSKR